MYRNGSLWTSHAVAGGTGDDYSRVRYVRLGVGGGPPTVLEDVSFGVDGCWYRPPLTADHPVSLIALGVGRLTNVNVVMTVTDTQNGSGQDLHQSPRIPVPADQDTNAIACP